MLPCNELDFWLCDPRVSGRGGSGPGRPSGMPRECTLIMAWDEMYSEGGGVVLDESILGTNAFDDQLASEEVVCTFFLRGGVCIGLLGVTVQSISGDEIGTRHRTGEQEATAEVAEEEHPGWNLEWLLPARGDTKGELNGGAWPY